MLAHFRCQKCKHMWKTKPGPVTCPSCEHDYIDWLNWEEVVKWSRQKYLKEKDAKETS